MYIRKTTEKLQKKAEKRPAKTGLSSAVKNQHDDYRRTNILIFSRLQDVCSELLKYLEALGS